MPPQPTVPHARLRWDPFHPLTWLLLAGTLALISVLLDPPSAVGPRPPAIWDTPLQWNVADAVLFARYGMDILSGTLSTAYADPVNQAGPAQLVATGLFAHLSALFGGFPSGAAVVQGIVSLMVLAGFGIAGYFLSRTALPTTPDGTKRTLLRWAPVASVAFAFLLTSHGNVYITGHWWQIPVVLTWWAAAIAVQRNQPLLAGTLIGVTVWFEPWGVFGVLTVLLATRWRTFFIAGFTSGLVGIAAWVPFLLQPDFAMPRFRWMFREDSMWALFLNPDERFPWEARLAQAILVMLIVAAVAWHARKQLNPTWAAWIIPLTVVLARIGTDVWWAYYYFTAAQVLLLPAAIVITIVQWRRGLPLLFAVYATFTIWAIPMVGPFITAIATAGVVAAVFLLPRWTPRCAARTPVEVTST